VKYFLVVRYFQIVVYRRLSDV